MNKEIHITLKAIDALPGDLYSPANYTYQDYLCIKENVQKLEDDLHKLLSSITIKHHSAQDASYAIRSIIYKHERPFLELMFSKFAGLATFSTFNSENLNKQKHINLIALLENHGFKYVDCRKLTMPYDGRHPVAASFTWWDRFFSEI